MGQGVTGVPWNAAPRAGARRCRVTADAPARANSSARLDFSRCVGADYRAFSSVGHRPAETRLKGLDLRCGTEPRESVVGCEANAVRRPYTLVSRDERKRNIATRSKSGRRLWPGCDLASSSWARGSQAGRADGAAGYPSSPLIVSSSVNTLMPDSSASRCASGLKPALDQMKRSRFWQ